jgi:hypothetical protein
MRRDALLRVGGWAAVIAGVLRVAASFTSSLGSDVERQSLYFIIDLLLLIAVFAAYLQVQEIVGGWGAAGFLTTVVGILLVRSSRAVPGLDLYPAGALAVALGWAVLGLASWRAGTASVFVPLLFVLSVVIAIVGQVVASSSSALVASGVIFGAAVVGVGRQVLAAVPTNR